MNNKANSTSFKKGHLGYRGASNPMWKGEKAGYYSKHDRIKVLFGRPNICEKCNCTDKKKYEWANLSGEYKTERSDWLRLCVSCHRIHDGHAKKMWETRRNAA